MIYFREAKTQKGQNTRNGGTERYCLAYFIVIKNNRGHACPT